MTRASYRRAGPILIGTALGLLAVSVSAQTDQVTLGLRGAGVSHDQVTLLPTFPLPQQNTRYGLEYRSGSRELLARPGAMMVCRPGLTDVLPASGPVLYLDPNGIRLNEGLDTVTIGGHPYRPYKFGSTALRGIDFMAYEVDAREFVVQLVPTTSGCEPVTRTVPPVAPELAICGGGLTDDPKDGWIDNSVFRASFDEASGAPDLEVTPWRETTAPSNQLRYGFLVRNRGTTTAQGVAFRETFAADALRFQRSLNAENPWSCRGYGGAYCDIWPGQAVPYDRGYMTTRVGTIPPNGCLKFESTRGFVSTANADLAEPSGTIAARVYVDGELPQTLNDNSVKFTY